MPAPLTPVPTGPIHPHRKRPLRLQVHSVLRWLHIYLSMFSLLVVLFFSVTGVTLNHPEWGNMETRREASGTLPAGWYAGNSVDWLKVAEYLRAQHHLHGTVGDHRFEGGEGALSFKGPGYAADCLFTQRTGEYRLTIIAQGAVGVLNDLHRGRDSGRTWGWLIDIAGIFLVLVSLTGIGLILYLKKMVKSGLLVMVVGILLILVLMKLAT